MKPCPAARRPVRPRRRGVALVYTTIAIVALIGFISLAVDLGRVQLVRGELQLAADAAARHAAHGFRSGGVSAAQSCAIDAADDNNADGTAVVLDRDEDIEFGTWNGSSRQFTKLPDDQRDKATALRVTARRTAARNNAVPLAWASLINMPTCDVTVRSVVRLAGPGGAGFIGLSGLQVGNNAVVAAYDASAGAPGGDNLTDGANLGSNGSVQVGNNSEVRGDVLMGPGSEFQQGHNAVLTGDESLLNSALAYPPTEAAPVASSGVLSVGHGQTRTLPAGTYAYSEIEIGHDATLTFSGDATVYVTSRVTLDNKATLAGQGLDPGKLKVRLNGAAAFAAANNATVISQVYGPGADFVAGNDLHLRGYVVARAVEFGNNARVYYDTHSAPPGESGTIVLLD